MSVRDFATKIGVATQAVYNWETGKNGVDDERAEKIRDIFGTDLIETRRKLGLWVPDIPTGPPLTNEEFKEVADRTEQNLAAAEAAFKRIAADPDPKARERLRRIMLRWALRMDQDEDRVAPAEADEDPGQAAEALDHRKSS